LCALRVLCGEHSFTLSLFHPFTLSLFHSFTLLPHLAVSVLSAALCYLCGALFSLSFDFQLLTFNFEPRPPLPAYYSHHQCSPITMSPSVSATPKPIKWALSTIPTSSSGLKSAASNSCAPSASTTSAWRSKTTRTWSSRTSTAATTIPLATTNSSPSAPASSKPRPAPSSSATKSSANPTTNSSPPATPST